MTPGQRIVRALDFAFLVVEQREDLCTVLMLSEQHLPIDYLPGVVVAMSTVERASHQRALAIAQEAGARIPANRAERRGERPSSGRLILPGQ